MSKTKTYNGSYRIDEKVYAKAKKKAEKNKTKLATLIAQAVSKFAGGEAETLKLTYEIDE